MSVCRLCHEVPWLYVNIHKIHHNHHGNLHVGSTLQMHPVDGLLTNTLPLLMAVFLVPIASHWEFHAYMAYKTAQELFGHCGVQIKVHTPMEQLVSYLFSQSLRIIESQLRSSTQRKLMKHCASPYFDRFHASIL